MNPRVLAGAIAAAALVGLGLMAVPAGAATFTVTTTADVVDAGDGVLSLREAIGGANVSAGADEIVLPAGVHTLTIPGTGGNYDNADGDLDHLDSGQLTIRGAGLDMTNGDAAGLGDRILDVRSGDLVIEDITVTNGDVVGGGGAIRAANSLAANRLRSTGNDATDGGGGIRVTGAAAARITASRFDGNHSDTNGGAVRGAGITATESVFSGNTADSAGGALYGPGPHSITRSLFDSNTALGNGGAVWDGDAALTITDSTFRANASPDNGGELRHRDGPLTITNSTFDANTAASGAAVWIRHSATSLTHVTIAGGGASGDGAVRSGGSATVTFASTVVPPDSGSACTISGTVVSSGSNAATDTSCGLTGGGHQNGTAVPDLQPLADNGGSTPTRLPGASSTLTDVASCAAAADQRGVARPESANCEIGAVELRIPVPQPDSATTPQDATINVDVADNDTVYDGHVDLTSVVTTVGPNNGSTTDVGEGTITYTPLPGWWGTDTFTYELCGPGESSCNTAVATITVTAAPTTTTTTTTSATVPPTTAPPTTVPPTTAPPTTSPPNTVSTQAQADAQNQAATPTSLPATGPTHAERLAVLGAALLFVGMTVLMISSGARRHPSRAVFRPQDGGWTRN